MKKIYLNSIIALIAILLCSCGSSEKELTLKNYSTKVGGDLANYLEVVEGSYKLAMVNGELILTAKFKVIVPLDENAEYEKIEAELLDESGMPLAGVGNFELQYEDKDKVLSALRSGSGEFAVQMQYFGNCTPEEALKIAMKSAKSFSVTTTADVYDGTPSTVTDNDTDLESTDEEQESENVEHESSGRNWDQVLSDYESYTDKYIRLLKKAASGDLSAATEYASMLEEAQSLQESLSDAEGELTSAQLKRFAQIQNKLVRAANNM
ncbi:MAG: hypothetical protein PHV24_00945 [Candidatus Kapabacteria bacterium]|nr:hypothetical protein [Candidatus Kapabacteria bacterium]